MVFAPHRTLASRLVLRCVRRRARSLGARRSFSFAAGVRVFRSFHPVRLRFSRVFSCSRVFSGVLVPDFPAFFSFFQKTANQPATIFGRALMPFSVVTGAPARALSPLPCERCSAARSFQDRKQGAGLPTQIHLLWHFLARASRSRTNHKIGEPAWVYECIGKMS